MVFFGIYHIYPKDPVVWFYLVTFIHNFLLKSKNFTIKLPMREFWLLLYLLHFLHFIDILWASQF